MTREAFELLVKESLDSLPEKFVNALDNLEIMVEDWSPPGTSLYGVYQGVAKTKRLNYSGVAPDIIVIYAGPLLMHFGGDLEVLKQQVRKTVLHEIGHHLGLSDEEIYKAQSKM